MTTQVGGLRSYVHRTRPDHASAGSLDVVIVPGLAVSRYLMPTAGELAASGAACELLDLPGFGASDDPPTPLDVHGFANVVADHLRDRKGKPVVLVGHSSGTQVAALTAVDAGLPIARVVLASPTLDPRYRRRLGRLLARWWKDGRREPKSLVRQQRPEWRRPGFRRIATLLRSMRKRHLEDVLPRVPCPVTVVRASEDPLCTQEWAAGLAAAGRLVTVPGLPHAFPYQDPAAVARLIL